MIAPNADGTSGTGSSTGTVVDNGVGGQNRTLILNTVADYKRGDIVLVTNVATLGGEYTVKFFLTPTANTFVDDDGTSTTYSVDAGTSVIITTTPSSIGTDGRVE